MNEDYKCNLNLDNILKEGDELFSSFEKILNLSEAIENEDIKHMCFSYFQNSNALLKGFVVSLIASVKIHHKRENIIKELNLTLEHLEHVDLTDQSPEGSVLICCLMNNLVNSIFLQTFSIVNNSAIITSDFKDLIAFYKKGCEILNLSWWSHLKLLKKTAKIIFYLIQDANVDIIGIISFVSSIIKNNNSSVKADKALLAYWEYAKKVSNAKEHTSVIKNYGFGFKVYNDLGNTRHKNKVVIAYSASTNAWHWLNNLSQLIGYSYLYIVAAGYLCTEINNHLPLKEFKVCGHSLGGGLAQFSVAANVKIHKGKSFEGICYNSAGLSKEMYNLLNNNAVYPIKHVFTQKDLVHKLGFLIGEFYVLDFPCKSYWHICYNHNERIFDDYMTYIQKTKK